MSRVNKSDADKFTADQKGIEMATMDTKGDFGTEMGKRLGQEIATKQFTSLWLFKLQFGHGKL